MLKGIVWMIGKEEKLPTDGYPIKLPKKGDIAWHSLSIMYQILFISGNVFNMIPLEI